MGEFSHNVDPEFALFQSYLDYKHASLASVDKKVRTKNLGLNYFGIS